MRKEKSISTDEWCEKYEEEFNFYCMKHHKVRSYIIEEMIKRFISQNEKN